MMSNSFARSLWGQLRTETVGLQGVRLSLPCRKPQSQLGGSGLTRGSRHSLQRTEQRIAGSQGQRVHVQLRREEGDFLEEEAMHQP